MRTAAARFRLGLAAASARKTISSSSHVSLFLRRFSSLAAAAADVSKKRGVEVMKSGSESEMELELNREKSIYLCFSEMSRCGAVEYVNHVVRAVKLNSDDDEDNEEEGYLQVSAYKRSSKLSGGWGICTRFGSQILFPSGPARLTDISWIDTSTRPLKFQNSSSKTKFKSFSNPKCSPVMGELNGKLYCIHHDPFPWHRHNQFPLHPFEVLDPENENPEWRPLEPPPIPHDRSTYESSASFLEGSNKIITWSRHDTGVFCFDATKPENGWTESSFSLGTTLPFLEYSRRPLFTPNHHHPNLGAFHLMFSYDPINAPLFVSAFFMSGDSGSFQRIGANPIQLPDLSCEYNDDFTPYDEYDFKLPVSTDFEFVYLGAQKVCLVLNKFFPHDYDHVQRRNSGILLLVTFEYDIITTTEDSKSDVKIQTRLLKTRRFRYQSRKMRKPDWIGTRELHLTGAFML